MTAACLETSVPVMPIAMPMSAFLRAGASLTPSPVMATTWPFLRRMSTRWTLSSGETRAMTPMPSIWLDGLVVAQGTEVGAGHGAALDAQLAGDRLGRDRVVAGDHPDLDARPHGPSRWPPSRPAAADRRCPTMASRVMPSSSGSRSAFGSNVAGSKSF